MREWLRDAFARRPLWMNALMLFSAYMALVYVPWDFFGKPLVADEEVWFGYRFTGWAAIRTPWCERVCAPSSSPNRAAISWSLRWATTPVAGTASLLVHRVRRIQRRRDAAPEHLAR